MIGARSTGTATVRCGLAAATIRIATASRNASSGTWRRQRGRRGATEAASARRGERRGRAAAVALQADVAGEPAAGTTTSASED